MSEAEDVAALSPDALASFIGSPTILLNPWGPQSTASVAGERRKSLWEGAEEEALEGWELDPAHLAIHPDRVLGSGAFGTVLFGRPSTLFAKPLHIYSQTFTLQRTKDWNLHAGADERRKLT